MTHEASKCIICGDLQSEGIRVRGKLICTSCEKDLVGTQVDQPVYEGYKEGIKAIWETAHQSGQFDGLEQDC